MSEARGSAHRPARPALLFAAAVLLLSHGAAPLPGEGAGGQAPVSLAPAPELDWRELYLRGRQAFNLGSSEIAEAWLREAARRQRPWPRKVVTVDNFPEPYLPYYHLSWSLLKLEQCPEAEGVLETSLRQGVLLAYPEKHRRLRQRLGRCGVAPDQEVGRAVDPGRVLRKAVSAVERWQALAESLGQPQRQELAERFPRLSGYLQQAEELKEGGEVVGSAASTQLIADRAMGAAARFEVLSCWLKDPEQLDRCETRQLADGVVKIEVFAKRWKARGSGFVVGLGPGAAQILTAGHVMEAKKTETEETETEETETEETETEETGEAEEPAEEGIGKIVALRFPAQPEELLVMAFGKSGEPLEVTDAELAETFRQWGRSRLPGRVVPVRGELHTDAGFDIALVRLSGEVPPARCLLLADDLPAETETVFTIGYPTAVTYLHWVLTQGSVAGPPEGDRLKTNVTVDAGNSGGPLIRRDGRVVGMVVARASAESEFAFARDARTLRDTLLGWNVELCRNDAYSLPPKR